MKFNIFSPILLSIYMMVGCSTINKTQLGAAMGTAGGGIAGEVVGRAYGNSAVGAIIGAAVGGVTGSVIGSKMDKQAEEIKKEVPGVKVERVAEGIVVEFNSKILFGYNQADLSAASKKNLDELTKVVQKYTNTNIEIQGHTDNKGSFNYNQSLSQRRAASVAQYLREKGIDNNRINIKGLGESSPKYDNDTVTGRTENRRVELLISANERMKEESRKEGETGGK
ncbi:MAG: OmpA family protein [Chitinophagaceae bacterium]